MTPEYRERLWPAAWLWVVAAGTAATFGVIFLPAGGPVVSVVMGLTGAAGLTALLAWWSPVLQVVEPEPGLGWWLRAGAARIPLAALGEVERLDPAAMTAAMGPELDARSHRCIRGWVATGVRVVVADERDVTPYWLVSTRHPDRLAAALARATASEGT